jgi:hypothetical protein
MFVVSWIRSEFSNPHLQSIGTCMGFCMCCSTSLYDFETAAIMFSISMTFFQILYPEAHSEVTSRNQSMMGQCKSLLFWRKEKVKL